MRKERGGLRLLATGVVAALLAFGSAAPTALAFAEDAPVAEAAATQSDVQSKAGETFTVSFWGGASQEVETGEKATPAPAPDYGDLPEIIGPNGKVEFVGWVDDGPQGLRTIYGNPTESDLAKLFDFSQPITKDVNLSAVFAAPSHMVGLYIDCLDEKGHDGCGHDTTLDPSVEGSQIIYEGNSLNDVATEAIAKLEASAKNHAREIGAEYKGLHYATWVTGEHGNTVTQLGEKVDLDKPIDSDVNIVAVVSVPGCDHYTSETFGVVVNDKQAVVDIPVAYGIDLLQVDPTMKASGVLSGANVPKGSRVWVHRVINGSPYQLELSFSLMVDGKPVESDFGTLNMSVNIGQFFGLNAEYHGKTCDLNVTTADGKRIAIPTKLTEDAWITFPFVPGKTIIGIGEESQNNNDQDAAKPQVVPVTGAEGVKVSGVLTGKNVPANADVKVNAVQLKAGDAAYDKLVASMGDGELAGVYDISLLVNNAEVHDKFGKLTITLPVDAKYNGRYVTVWHLHNDGTVSSETVVAKDGAVTFTVTDLSSFALEIGELAQDEVNKDTSVSGELPQTGDPAAIMGAIAFSGAALASVGILSKKRR